MYSENIEKICRYCQWAKPAVGVEGYMQCSVHGGYLRVSHSCESFKYDIMKIQVRRKPDVTAHGFTAADFSLD